MDSGLVRNFDAQNYQQWEIKGFRDIRKIETSSPIVHHASIQVGSNRLKKHGILRGDYLIFQIEPNFFAVPEGALIICQGECGKIAMFADEHRDEKLLGFVVRIERDFVFKKNR